MTTVTCDRCGKPADYVVRLTGHSGEIYDLEVLRADLCSECATNLNQQITNLEVKPL